MIKAAIFDMFETLVTMSDAAGVSAGDALGGNP